MLDKLAISTPSQIVKKPRRSRRSRGRHFRNHQRAATVRAFTAADRLRNDRERDFVTGMVRRTVHGGRLSEKQAACCAQSTHGWNNEGSPLVVAVSQG
jgi:hypothetical protein